MVAEYENIGLRDEGGFIADFVDDSGGIWHFHPEIELALHMKSNGTRIIGDCVELFDHYDMVLISGNIPHSWNYYKGESGLPEKHGIMLHFTSDSLGDNLLAQHELRCLRELLVQAEGAVFFPADDARIAEKYMVQMINETGMPKMIAFFNLFNVLCNSSKRTIINGQNFRQNTEDPENRKMADIYNYIRENYFRPISLEKISDFAGMSPFTFSRFFKKNCGAGFVEYLNRVRTNKACYLLRETAYHVNEIAVECGFSSISNFNKQFRKTEGLSPRDYRSQFQ